MTLVELYGKMPCNNIYSCLAISPERVIFIGSDSKDMKRSAEIFRGIFSERGQKTEAFYKVVPRNDISCVISLMDEIVSTYDDCVFDITGGDEMLVFALGRFCEKSKEKSFEIHSFSLANNSICDCDGNGKTTERQVPALSVRENIMLHGGSCNWDSRRRNEESAEFKNDVMKLFSICRENPRGWNSQMNILAAIEEIGEKKGNTTLLDNKKLKAFLERRKSRIIFNKPIMQNLLSARLITEYRVDDNGVVITYKNADIKNCLTKAGLVLELAVYLAAKECHEKDGTRIYNDAATGVIIDWDGKDLLYDTKNEIDVLLMHGITPVFISCKNGYVAVDELYKLSTVAERFGGAFAKKVLVATELDIDSDNGKYLVARAKDMGINVICGENPFRERVFEKNISNLWKI